MNTYRLYFLRAAQFAGADEIEAENDLDAARAVRDRAFDQRVEIWRGGRKIRTVGPLNHLRSGA